MKTGFIDSLGAVAAGKVPNRPPVTSSTYHHQPENAMSQMESSSSSSSSAQITEEEALGYLANIEKEFQNDSQNPDIYKLFLNIMKKFKSQEIDTPGVIAQVSELFRGHDHLILGFNTFLPPDQKITVEQLRTMNQIYYERQRSMTTHPVFFSTSSNATRLVQLSPPQTTSTSPPSSPSSSPSPSSPSSPSPSTSSLRVTIITSVSVRPSSGILLPHHFSKEHVCARLDGSGVRVYLPRKKYGARTENLGWWLEEKVKENRNTRKTRNQQNQQNEHLTKKRMVHKHVMVSISKRKRASIAYMESTVD